MAISIDDNFFMRLIDALSDGIYVVDRERRIIYWNKGAERISGYAAHEVTGSFCYDKILQHVDLAGCLVCGSGCPLAETMGDGLPHTADVYLHHKYGHRVPVQVRATPLRDADGTIIGAVELFNECAPFGAEKEELIALRSEALRDPLTQFGNRRLLEGKVTAYLHALHHTGKPFGLLFCDIDHFKRVNDTYGHPVGDAVLKMVAQTMANCVRPADTLARWGGEEFVIVVRQVSAKGLAALAERVRVMVAQSFLTQGPDTIRVTISIGATLAQQDDTLETLLTRADRLLYRSKDVGRNIVSLG